MRVLIFGASSVEGWWDGQGGWVDRLKRHYNNLQTQDWGKRQLRIMNLGVAGQGSKDLLIRMENEARARDYERGITIMISIGSNDAAVKDGVKEAPEDFAKNVTQLLHTAKSLTKNVIFVGLPAVNESKTMPLLNTGHYFSNERVQLFENTAKSICREKGVPFIPIHQKFQLSGNDLNAQDGLHPNDKGHELIFNLVRPELDKLINT